MRHAGPAPTGRPRAGPLQGGGSGHDRQATGVRIVTRWARAPGRTRAWVPVVGGSPATPGRRCRPGAAHDARFSRRPHPRSPSRDPRRSHGSTTGTRGLDPLPRPQQARRRTRLPGPGPAVRGGAVPRRRQVGPAAQGGGPGRRRRRPGRGARDRHRDQEGADDHRRGGRRSRDPQGQVLLPGEEHDDHHTRLRGGGSSKAPSWSAATE